MGQGQGPQTQITGCVRHRSKDKLNGFDQLVYHENAKAAVFVTVTTSVLPGLLQGYLLEEFEKLRWFLGEVKRVSRRLILYSVELVNTLAFLSPVIVLFFLFKFHIQEVGFSVLDGAREVEGVRW